MGMRATPAFLVHPAIPVQQPFLFCAQIAKLLLRVVLQPRFRRTPILLAHGHRKHLRLSPLVLTFVHAQQPPQEQLDDRTHHEQPRAIAKNRADVDVARLV